MRFLELPKEPVHVVLAAPPCTMFARSGMRWKRTPEQMAHALSIVDACLRFVAVCRPEAWAIENPIGTLHRWLGPPRLYFHPWEYAGWLERPEQEAYNKRTCLWGNFRSPEKRPVPPRDLPGVPKCLGGANRIHFAKPGPERAAFRSATPLGFARAFFAANP